MIRIRRIAVVATATTMAITGGAVVLAIALLMVLTLLAGGSGPVVVPFGGGGLMILLAPLFYAAFVWIFTALICLAYNAAAALTGGIGFTAERESPHPIDEPTPTPSTTR